MGWLSVIRDGTELYYSDEALDHADVFLRQLARVYEQSELGRRPTLEEVLLNVELVLTPSLQEYTSEAGRVELLSVTARKQSRRDSVKAKVGDVLAIPVGADRFAFAQVLEGDARGGVLGVWPHINSKAALPESERSKPFAAQLRGAFSCVAAGHWQVLDRQSVPPNVQITASPNYSPCFVLELEVIDILKERNLLPNSYRMYHDLGAVSAKLHDANKNILREVMRFLREHRLLTSAGAKAAAVDIGDDFVLDSELLTEAGNKFYGRVFDKSYTSDYLYRDTYRKLEETLKEVSPD
jgi:hypothetical protein